MVWNYQILKHKGIDENDNWYSIHEVYRDSAGKIMACTDGIGILPSEKPVEVIASLKMMLKDSENYPVYDYDNVPEDGAEDIGGG